MTTQSVQCARADNDAVMAQQLSEQYRRVEASMVEIVRFGAMLVHLRDNIVNPRVDRGLAGWLERNCPEITQGTAYRYMALADGIREHLRISQRVDIARLLGSTSDELKPAERNHRKRITELLDGKSQRQLVFEFAARATGHKPGGDMRLLAWLREHHPEIEGASRAELSPKVAEEYRAFAEAARREERGGMTLREYNAAEFFRRLEHDLALAVSRYQYHLHVGIARLKQIDEALMAYRRTIRETIDRG